MTFEEYWADMVGRGFEETGANRSLAMSAWDAALCSAGARAFERGKLRSAQEVHAGISHLHSWHKPTTDTPS